MSTHGADDRKAGNSPLHPHLSLYSMNFRREEGEWMHSFSGHRAGNLAAEEVAWRFPTDFDQAEIPRKRLAGEL